MSNHDLAEKIIDSYCEKHNFQRSYFTMKCGKVPVKNYKEVKVFKHRQVLSLYLNEVLKIPMAHIGPMVGYADHSTVCNNIKKFKFLLHNGDPEINNMYSNLNDWANIFVKKTLTLK